MQGRRVQQHHPTVVLLAGRPVSRKSLKWLVVNADSAGTGLNSKHACYDCQSPDSGVLAARSLRSKLGGAVRCSAR
jgi:hypothetical protein